MAKNKVLIISANSFSKKTNNGKTMEAMFSEFEKQQLMQLFFSMNEFPDESFCDNYYKFTDMDLLKSYFSRIFNTNKQNNITDLKEAKSVPIFNFLKLLFASCPFLRELVWIRAYANRNITNWITLNKPNMIFLYTGNLTYIYDFALYYSELFKIPLFVYFTDDYAYFPSSRNVFSFLQKMWIRKKYKQVISKSKMCFGIGADMCEYYSKIYKKDFYPIMNSVIIPSNVSIHTSINNDKDINLTYIGGLTIGRDKSLLELSSLINSLNLKNKIQINIYTATTLSKCVINKFISQGVIIHKPVYGDELEIVKENANVLIHIESTKRRYYSLAQLSISTKIPEYLITGKRILAYGPSHLSSFRLLQDNNLGFVIPSELNKFEKRKRLLLFFRNYYTSSVQVKNAFEYANKKFNKITNSKLFHHFLNQ